MRLPLGAGALAGCLVLTGACGGGDGANAKRFDGDQQDVAAVIDDLQSAAREGKADTICEDVFSSGLTKAVERETGGSCEKRVRSTLVSKKTTLTADGVRLDGKEKAIVNVTDGRQNHNVLYLSKFDDGWRITRIAR